MAAERTQADDIIDLIKQQGEMMKGMLDVMMYEQKSKEDGSQKMLGKERWKATWLDRTSHHSRNSKVAIPNE